MTQGAHTADYCAVFAEARAERMAFHNPLQNREFTQAIYLAPLKAGRNKIKWRRIGTMRGA